MIGPGFYNRASDFETVYADSTAGGDDTAKMYDSVGDDTFYGKSNVSSMLGTGYYNRVTDFEKVQAFASTGTDTARLYDSVGDDTFRAEPTWAALYNSSPKFGNQATAFDVVHAYMDFRGGDSDTLVIAPIGTLQYTLYLHT
jgi:hypothetical protein